MPTKLPPPLSEMESSPQFLSLSPEGQVKVYDRWRLWAMDSVEDEDDKAFLDNLVRGKVQERLESRGITGEMAQSFKEGFLGQKANFTRGINGAVAQAARIAASELATQFPGTDEKETQIAVTNQSIIRETDKQMDQLREEFVDLGKDPKANRDRRVEIAKTLRALEETKRKSEETLQPIIDKTKAESWLGEFAGNQQLAADRAKASLNQLRNRFRTSEKFKEESPVRNAIARGAGELPAMIAQTLGGGGSVRAGLKLASRPGLLSLALDLGQRSEDMAREIYPDLTDGEGFVIRTTSGTVQMSLERLGIDAALGKAFGGAAGLSGGQIVSRLRRGAIGGATEGITEPIQSILEGEIIQAVTGEEVDTIFTPEAFKERLVDALAGVALGGGLGALTGRPRTPTEGVPKMARGTEAPPLTPQEATSPTGSAPTGTPIQRSDTEKALMTPEELADPFSLSPKEIRDRAFRATFEPTSEPTAPEAPPLSSEQTEGPVGLVQRADQQDVLVQFQSDRDKSLFDAYRRFTKGESAPEDTALIKDATEQGVDVTAFGRDVQAATDAADPNTIISAPPLPPLSQELQEASRRAAEEQAADVPRGTNEPPATPQGEIPGQEPLGPPKAPREVFRQVRSAVSGIPGVKTAIRQRKKGSGVTFRSNGQIDFSVTPSDLQGQGDDVRFVMDEEVTHLAEVLGARDEWEAGGKEGTFPAFLDRRAKEHVARIDEELSDLRSADRQIAARSLVESIRAYTRAGEDQNVDFERLEQASQTGSISDVMAAARESGVIGSDGAIFAEWLRQIDQLERTGTTTELAGESDPGVFARLKDAIVDALRKAIDWIDRGRSILRKSPTFTGDIDAITRKRQELSLPALTRPQTTQETPPVEAPRASPEVVERQGTEGMPTEEAATVHRVSDPPPSPPLRTTKPGEGDGFVVGLQKSEIDLEREAWNLPPWEGRMRKAFGEDWGPAQKSNMDGREGSALVNSLLENSRPLSTRELAVLGHEMVRRRHELDRSMVDLNNPTNSARQRDLAFNDFREAQVAYNRLADAIQNSSSELGRSLNFLKILSDEQFNLVTLKRSRQAGVNGGEPLTEKQERQIEGFYNRVQQLQAALAKAKTPKAKGQIQFDLAKAITDQIAQDNKEIFKRLSVGGKALAASTEVMNLARAMMTTFDFSATLRQGGLVTVSHPILASKAFEAQMKAFASERGEFEVMQGIRNDPLYAVMVADGNILHIGETTLQVELDSRQRARDEAYQSVISQKIPVVKGFGRAYQTFMNQLRFDYYKLLVDNLGGGTPEQRNAIAKFVNITTGRGGPRDMGDVAGFFGAIFFAPRYVASRFQYLMTLPNIMSQPKGVRLLIAKEFGRQLVGIGGVIGLFLLAKEAFDEEDEWGIEWDARSSDFAKLRIGNTRVDVLSGLQQIIVLEERMRHGEIKKSTGEIEAKDPLSTGGRFLRTKLSPVVGTFGNILSGKDVVYKPAGLLDMQDIPIMTNMTGARGPAPFVNLFVPLAFREVVDAMEKQGVVKGTALSLATLLGWSASTYQPGEDFGESAGGLGKLVDEYGYGGLIKELYTRSSDEAKLLLKAFDEDKPAVLTRP